MQQQNKVYGKPTPPQTNSSCRYRLSIHRAAVILYSMLTMLSAGFTITMYEYERTIQTLWATVKGASASKLPTGLRIYCHLQLNYHVTDFMLKHPEYVAQDNAAGFMAKDGGEKYNLCHCK
jgi:hypothetical protein